jgi:O-Antigen ligase
MVKALRESPGLVPMMAGIGVFLVLGASDGGYFPTAWYPAGLFLLALLGVSAAALGPPRGVPRAALAALALLSCYAAWAYLSIAWAEQQGTAWEGANRAAVYAVVYALFVLWPVTPAAGHLVPAALGLGIAGIGVVELLRVDGAGDPISYFIEVRLAEPAGYINANVAFWTLGALACLASAAARDVPVPVRALALGGGGLLLALALMGQSRGWILALPVALIVFVLLGPGRVRRLWAVAAAAGGTALVSGSVLAVRDDFTPGGLDGLVHRAATAILLLAAALTVFGLVWGVLDRRVRLSPAVSRGVRLGTAAAAALAIAGGVAAFVVSEGSPVTKASTAWDEFKSNDTAPGVRSSRFASAGTNRHDFWSVAVEVFADHPVGGVGADNFQPEYLRRGDSREQPRFAHSLPLGVLAQTGVVGAVLLAAALLSAVLAGAGARRSGAAAGGVAAASLAIFGYWLLHGSVDWFWEFPALAGPAFAMLGLAGALAPRRPPGRRNSTRRGVAGIVLAGAVGLALAASLGAPWLAERQIARASEDWREDPTAAFRRLDRAESLNPLSPQPALTAGTIALRLDRRELAARRFRAALEREPRNAYALLELGLLAGERGDRGRAVRLLVRARAESPNDAIVRHALRGAQRGRPPSTDQVNARILRRARARAPTSAP